jgi:hypothetical protein
VIKPLSFHSTVDAGLHAYQVQTQGLIWGPSPVLIVDRTVSYQFQPHFHPYVSSNRAAIPGMQLSLFGRLEEGGLDEFEDSDTLYMTQPAPAAPQPLTVTPGSTRATLSATTSATRVTDGSTVSLSAGTPATLPDGVTVTVPAGATVTHTDGSSSVLGAARSLVLPGAIPVSSSSGIQIPATDIVVPDYTAVTLPNATTVVLTNDGSQATLPGGTGIAMRAGIPQPFFYEGVFDGTHYNPSSWVSEPYPVKNIDFTVSGAYSLYNWEMFFHAPLMVAIHLSQNSKFQDAQNWFHYIFNPFDNSPGPTPERFWKVQPFQYTDVQIIRDILVNLSTNQDPVLRQQTIASISDWMKNPFQPWTVAQYRPTAYMLKTVMAYLDNLIAWGDSLFRQYTIETINEATQLYIIAANILGPKPQPTPAKGTVKKLTYNQLRGKLDAFGDALVDMEVDMPFDIVAPTGSGTASGGAQILSSIGQTLYFCIPRNDQLLAYWDTVADRLFKIHNSLNLQGVFQQLPLYDPPIDPALLVRAAASGLDVSAVVSGLNQPLPLVRFPVLIARAVELAQMVASLGSNLQGAIEKQDSESLSLLRAQQDKAVVQLANTVKYAQWKDAEKATQALQLTLATAVQRYAYYQKLLGRSDTDIQNSIPPLDKLDIGSLQSLSFTQVDTGSEPLIGLAVVAPDIAQDPTKVTDGATVTLSNNEVTELAKLQAARDSQKSAEDEDHKAGDFGKIPDFGINVNTFMNVGLSTTMGGTYVAKFPQQSAQSDRADADGSTYEANKASKIGSYSRRLLDWTFQSNSAVSDINQIQKQIRGAQIREAIAQMEYDNYQTQIANAQQIVDFLQGNDVGDAYPSKKTTIGFYAYMQRELKALHANAFQLAFDEARKAERALQNELGDSSLTYVKYDYLDGPDGLLAGERLVLDLRNMEAAYQNLNQREYELTKHVSLLQVAPMALLQLRTTGSCFFTLPEEAFDLDGPGHYFRRLKSVALTIPCVAGRYTSVNCTLTLQKSSVRMSTGLQNGKYARQGSDDPRFNDYYGTVASIVTSSAQSDSGLFETNLRDERYLPFEMMGVAGSQWQLTLPADLPQFDFDTITGVVLHMRYTAREGGEQLKSAAVANLQTLIKGGQTVGSTSLFSVRHDFAAQWAKFKSVTIAAGTPTAELQLDLVEELYPYWTQGAPGSAQKPITLKAVELFAELPAGDSATSIAITAKADGTGNKDTLVLSPQFGAMLAGSVAKIPLPAAVTDAAHPPLTLYFDHNQMKDLWIALTWSQ